MTPHPRGFPARVERWAEQGRGARNRMMGPCFRRRSRVDFRPLGLAPPRSVHASGSGFGFFRRDRGRFELATPGSLDPVQPLLSNSARDGLETTGVPRMTAPVEAVRIRPKACNGGPPRFAAAYPARPIPAAASEPGSWRLSLRWGRGGLCGGGGMAGVWRRKILFHARSSQPLTPAKAGVSVREKFETATGLPLRREDEGRGTRPIDSDRPWL